MENHSRTYREIFDEPFKYLHFKYPGQATFWTATEEIIDRTERHHIYLLSAGIAFNVLVCIVPLILLAIFLVGLFLDPTALTLIVGQSLQEALPKSPATSEFIWSVMKEVNLIGSTSSTAGLVGLGILLWVASALFSSLRAGLNAIFHIPSPHFFLFYRLKDIGLTIVMAILVFASALLPPLLNLFRSLGGEFFSETLETLLSNAVITTFSFVTSALLFYFLYRFVPNDKIPRPIRLMSTVLCVFFWEGARYLFAWYLGSVSNMGRFYGGYAVLFSSVLWIYYSALIVLFSAEIAKYWHEQREAKREAIAQSQEQELLKESEQSEQMDADGIM